MVPFERSLDGMLGLEVEELGEDRATARFTVGDRHRQMLGIVHGGVYAAFAEGLASGATYLAVRERGEIALGISNHTSFLRPVREGVVEVAAIPRHRGRTTWVWEVEFTDGQGRLCALTRVTLAVRPGSG
jgi:1,4-dihydroxy-2-naphthoyl-CoA hydrolase